MDAEVPVSPRARRHERPSSLLRNVLINVLASIITFVLLAALAQAKDLVAYVGPWPPWASTRIAITPSPGMVSACAVIQGSSAASVGRSGSAG